MKPDGDQLMKPPEVANWIGVSMQTLYQWRCRGQGPRGIRVGKFLRYRRADVEAWLEQHSDPRPAA